MAKSNERKLFGTDGIRGLANEFPMTGEVAMQVGAATAKVLLDRIGGQHRTTYPHPRVIIGKDTRISSYMIEQALSSGICSAGADVLLVGPLPTPAIAFLVHSMRADAGIMISASHNSFEDNGIKIFDHEGYKLPDKLEIQIEELVFSYLGKAGASGQRKGAPINADIGRAVRIDDALGRYISSLKGVSARGFNLDGMTVAIDCANGAGYRVGPLLFKELGARVIKRGVAPNGTNINKKVGALYPEVAAGAVVEFKADIGISIDGDADRLILCDENGEKVDGDQIMGICALELKREGRLAKNTVVSTPMSNMGLEIMLKEHGIDLVRVPVGDRYVMEEMRSSGFNFGGEQSGHIIFSDFASTGDGLLAAVKVLELMKRLDKPLSELKKTVQLLPQVREDVRVREKPPLESLPEVMKLIKEAEKNMNGRGRVFVRYSGTEPLARVMMEGEDGTEIRRECKKIAAAFNAAVGEES